MRLYPIPLLIAATVACQSSSNERPTPVFEDGASEGSVSENTTTPVEVPTEVPAWASAPANQDPADIDDERDRLTVLQEQSRTLSIQNVELAKTRLNQADFEGALLAAADAYNADPTNPDALAVLRQVQSLLDESGTGTEFLDHHDAVQRQQVWLAKTRMEAETYNLRGKTAFGAGSYDEAILLWRQAETILRYHPVIEDDTLEETIIRGQIAEAIRMRDEAIARDEAERLAAAEEAKRKREEAERKRRETRLMSHYEQANKAFLAERYKEAEKWCQLILVEDPSNQAAASLAEVAREARHLKADEENRRNYREQWMITFDELDMMDVPQTDPVAYSIDRWRELDGKMPLSHGKLAQAKDDGRSEILAILEATVFEPNFGGIDDEGTPLESVRSYLQTLTPNVNFIVSSGVINDLDEDETAVRLRLGERSVRNVLDLIAESSESLRWKIEDGVVKFVTVDEMIGGQVRLTYGVQDLIHPIPDYPGRDINVNPSGGIFPPDEDLPERESNVIEQSMLEDLIINSIAPESWDADAANTIRITDAGIMTVNQTPEVHEKIQDLLEQLREATGIMVDIQARFMKVEDTFLEDIGIDLRGLGAPGLGDGSNAFNDFGDQSAQDDLSDFPGRDNTLGAFYDEGGDGDIRARVEDLYDSQLGSDDFQGSGGLTFQWTFLNDLELQMMLRAVQKSERLQLVTAPRILVHNTARANLSILNQVAYLQDFDVEIAQAASIADPIVAVIQDGVILDVRPVVSADRRFVVLELRPTVAVLKRPIEERVTTLGSQNSVTIMLPEVEIQRVRTSVPLPDKGTVLLGGMKESQKQDFRSGVPILNKIPLLSAFFERKGNFVSNRKLLILLSAEIIIPEELEPTRAEMGLAE